MIPIVPDVMEASRHKAHEDTKPSDPIETVDPEREAPLRKQLLGAMEKSGWVQAKAARLMNMTPRQMGYALKKFNIEVKRF